MTKKTRPDAPGNDVLNGIERWIPEGGLPVPKKFKYESPNHVWYKNELEACACLERAGIPESEWCPIPTGPLVSGEKTEETEKEG